MANTRVNIKGVDPTNIASETDAQNGTALDKLSTSYTTKVAIDYNTKNLPQIGRGLSLQSLQSFTVTTTAIVLPAQHYAMSDFTISNNSSQKTKTITTTFAAGDNQGCLDAGTLLNSTYYYVYAISNANNTLLDGLISLSATAPTLPTGYTKSVRIGTIKTSSIGEIEQYKSFNESLIQSGSPKIHTAIYGTPATLSSQYLIQFNSGLGAETSKFSFDSSGNFTASGNVTAYSDARLKENIKPLEDCLKIVKELQGVSYNKKYETIREIGLIAQEVEAVLPEIVFEGPDTIKSIAYQNIVAVLIEAIKELDKKISNLEHKERMHSGKLGG